MGPCFEGGVFRNSLFIVCFCCCAPVVGGVWMHVRSCVQLLSLAVASM